MTQNHTIRQPEVAEFLGFLSAGTKPAGYIHPKALAALAEIGIEHEGTSKLADEFHDVDFDLVVTVCEDAAANCPVWLGEGVRVHRGFPDPAKAQRDDEAVMDIFRQVRDAIALQTIDLLKQDQFEDEIRQNFRLSQ